jgi:hypothetical protein
MGDIFTDYKIYPHEGKIKEHFKDFYDSVYIALLPFFQIDRQPAIPTNLSKSIIISYEEAKKKLDFLNNIPPFNAHIYSHSNKDYPIEEEVFLSGKIITWDKVYKKSGLANYSELNKALKTSIGSLRQVFQRQDLAKKMINYSAKHNIWHPTEGGFDILSKISIYKAFKLLGKNEIVVSDDYESTSILELDRLTEFEFSKKVTFQDCYIYSKDKEVLFTIEWDSFFFLIASDNEKMKEIVEANLFEVFLCDEQTQHNWDYSEEELQVLLDLEERAKTTKPLTKKKWWEFWK